MKTNFIFKSSIAILLAANCLTPAAFSQNENADAEQKRATEWADTLKLDDAAKTARVTDRKSVV